MRGLLETALNNPLCRRSSSCSLSVTLTMAPRSLMTEELKFSCSMTLATMARWRRRWRRRRGGVEAGGRGAARSPAGGESCHLGVCSVSVFSLSHKCFGKYFAGFDSFIQIIKEKTSTHQGYQSSIIELRVKWKHLNNISAATKCIQNQDYMHWLHCETKSGLWFQIATDQLFIHHQFVAVGVFH